MESKVVSSDATRGGYENFVVKPNREYLFLCSSRYMVTKIALDETETCVDYIFSSTLLMKGIKLCSRLKKEYSGVIIDGHRVGLVIADLYSSIKDLDLFIRLRGDIWHEVNNGALSSWYNKYLVKIGDCSLIRAKSIISVSNYLKERIISRYPFLEQKITIVPPAIDVNFFIKEKKKKSNTIRLITVTNFNHWKKISPLIEHIDQFETLLKSIENISIDIIGGGKHLEKVVNYYIERGVNVNFHGYVQNVKDYLNTADIYFHLSKLDTFGKSVIEAQSMQLPAVISNSCGLPETIHDKKTGFLVNNPEEFLNKVYYLIENKKIRHEMGYDARQHVLDNFSPWIIGKKFSEILEE